MLGQVLYLEAEAAGVRSTGIGCFFDDEMHALLGIHDYSWQSLYHFTVGGAIDRYPALHLAAVRVPALKRRAVKATACPDSYNWSVRFTARPTRAAPSFGQTPRT